MKKKKPESFIFLVMALVLLLVYLTGESYYQGLMGETGREQGGSSVYRYKCDMIVDSPESSFWQAVYQSAKKSAGENDVLLELKGTGGESGYDKNDLMAMSIASHADGIILQYSGEADLEDKINQAAESGIPVVTVMSDAVRSKRQSFVGISDYQLGTVYGEKVADYVNADTKRILILLKRNVDDMDQSQIYTQISNEAQAAAQEGQTIEVTGRNLPSSSAFETEEMVADIFQQKEEIPDILVCMDEETTECARQAVIDYNLAGQVTIIGYYTSEDILAAVEKGVISVTCDVSTEQLGTYSVEAITEYLAVGRANSYYNVDLHFIGKEEARERREAKEQ